MSKSKQSEAKLSLLFLLLGVASVAWGGYWYLCTKYIPIGEHSAEWRGQFGDMFGGINALFSACAFAGLIYTVLLQRQELSLQRHELELTRQELSRSARAQEDASGALAAQIEMQVLASRLNGLRTLLTSVNAQIGSMRADNRAWAGTSRAWEMDDIEAHRQQIETEIEELLLTLQKKNS